MKNKLFIIILIAIIILVLIMTTYLIKNLSSNKTFFKTTFVGIGDKQIFIPKYSYFKRESGASVAEFYSLKAKKSLQKEIDNYLKDFIYDLDKHKYKKGDLTIQSYEVSDCILYRKIHICYDPFD